MSVVLKCQYKVGNSVRFRSTNMSVAAQYVPKGLKGTVSAAYLTMRGIALQELLDINFSIKDPERPMAQPEIVEIRMIEANAVEKCG